MPVAENVRGKARRKRVLSGMRPTGRLHIGHYFGALQNWLKLQEQQKEYECFFFIADWHALTTHYADDTQEVGENTVQVAIDWLSVGLDPAKSTIFVQSQVLEHAELHLLLSMVTPLSWLERVPTYKEQIVNLKERDLGTYGFLGYPLLQAADIVMYGQPKAELLVPVGEDQVPHVELTREIVRRFNLFYGTRLKEELYDPLNWRDRWEIFQAAGIIGVPPPPELNDSVLARLDTSVRSMIGELAADQRMLVESNLRRQICDMGSVNYFEKIGKKRKYFRAMEVLHEPSAMLTETPRLPGLDGRRMAKSYGNAIWLSESDDSIRAKTKVMMTDPARKRREDPGNPDVCPVFSWHKLFSPPETIAWSDQGCRTAGIGCIECKAAMADNLIRWIEPIRARRQKYERNPAEVSKILAAGSKKAHRVAGKTMRRVREAVFGHAAAKLAGSSRKMQAATGS